MDVTVAFQSTPELEHVLSSHTPDRILPVTDLSHLGSVCPVLNCSLTLKGLYIIFIAFQELTNPRYSAAKQVLSSG